MGTNYYAIPQANDDLKEKIILCIKEDRFEEAIELIPTLVHIGKSSAGWQFLFNHNNWTYFDKSLDSLISFLKKSKIEDEYGRNVDFDEFWAIVESKKHLIDNKEYFTNWHKYHDKPPENIPDNFWQETHFGLFFSDSVEFS